MRWPRAEAADLGPAPAVAVVARVVWGLLGPLLPYLFVLLVLGALILNVIRGPHAGR